MKKIFIICILAAAACPSVMAMTDDDLLESGISTDAIKGDYSSEDEDTLGIIQESDEDLSAFVQDYISKDSALKGAFFLEEPATGRILKLSLGILAKKTTDGPNNSKIVEAVFKDRAGKKYPVLFYIQSAGFGGLDICKIELKKEEKPKKK